MLNRTSTLSQAGPPSLMACTRIAAIKKYGTANSIAGTPHLRPRGVRIASSRILVGIYRRRKFRVRTLPVQSKRITVSFLSIAQTTPTRRRSEERRVGKEDEARGRDE